ncbi:MAG: carotenoid oxygenase family protein [Deltaproteobacteria bacterium]|nr:carotenoid oxygenase family protein [Deltaproteobacteria bacterium]
MSTQRTTKSAQGASDPTSMVLAESRRKIAARSWVSAHAGVTETFDVALKCISGEIPRDLVGVLFRNGPGTFELFGTRYGHLFDGDGHVQRLAFDGSTVRYRDRFVDTRERQREREAGRMLYRAFGSNRPGGMRANAFDPIFKNAANTTAFAHRGALYALWEAGLPHRLDPVTLDTLAREDFAEALLAPPTRWTEIAGRERPFSAHPKVDPRTGEMHNFGLANGPFSSLVLYRMSAEGVMQAPEVHRLDAMYFVHDFALTEHHRLLFLCPARFDVVRTMLGLRTPVSGMQYDPSRGTKIWIVPREGGEPTVLEAPLGFVFHHVNAWENADKTIVCDALVYGHYPTLPHPWDLDTLAIAPARADLAYVTRITLDPTRRVVQSERWLDLPCELPGIDPARVGQPYRYAWVTATDRHRPMQVVTRVAKLDMHTRTTVEREFFPRVVGEPVFVARDGASTQDEGWLIVMAYDPTEDRGECHVLDAATLESVCVLALPHACPLGFHGSFVRG